MVSQLCVDGTWEDQSDCLAQGECGPGEVDSEPLPLCGEQQRICDNECQWSEWSETTPGTGDCEPGAEQMAQADCADGLTRHQTCSDTCAWVSDAPCLDACGEVPTVAAHEDEEEVCIPAGPFIRGGDDGDSQLALPVAEVLLSSAYYIDKYVVTNRRYRECVDAGVCTPPMASDGAAQFDDPAFDTHPVLDVTWDQARTLCEWEGRRLVTEAEWEKAARGPSPRDNPYTWDGTDYRCDLLFASHCPGFVFDPDEPVTEPYFANPGAVSYYGVEGMLGAGTSWVSDYFDPDYYDLPESLIDPTGPATGDTHAVRGRLRVFSNALSSVFRRFYGIPGSSTGQGLTIRCGRDATPL
jgi:formylglycine-generating enzyme required for sulfatase activity